MGHRDDVGSRTRTRGAWAAYGAAAWALTFSTFHFMWAAGWYVGLDHGSAQEAFQRRWFLVYDLVVAVVCLLAVAVALALVRPWGRRLPRRLLGGLAWSGTGLLALRGGAGVLQSAYFVATGAAWSPRSAFWQVWFCIGAALFGLGTWRFWRASRLPQATTHS